MNMSYMNIEIKVRCSNQEKIREILKSNNASYKGTDHQIDTYFNNVRHGRLKLREGNIENALIYYDRENVDGPKKCECILYETKPDSSLKEILGKALGVMVIVDKKERSILLIILNFT